MANFAILRTSKLKSFGNISASLSHNYRTRTTPNADPAREGRNKHVFAGKVSTGEPPKGADVLDAIKARLPEKYRSDAVLCIEYLITCSPGALKSEKEHLAYLGEAKRWLESRHGKQNVVALSVHFDETTPHLAAYVVPIDKSGRLNCKSFLGGKAKLTAMQSEFARVVGEKYGLQRGIKGSPSEHLEIQKWYGLMSQPNAPLEIPAGELKPKTVGKRFGLLGVTETPDETEKRVQGLLNELVEPLQSKAKMSEIANAKVAKMQKRMAELEKRVAEAEHRAATAEQRAIESLKSEKAAAAVQESTKRDYSRLVEITQRVSAVEAPRPEAVQRTSPSRPKP
jgi:uncharacterized protein YdcH (DUF465 family)